MNQIGATFFLAARTLPRALSLEALNYMSDFERLGRPILDSATRGVDQATLSDDAQLPAMRREALWCTNVVGPLPQAARFDGKLLLVLPSAYPFLTDTTSVPRGRLLAQFAADLWSKLIDAYVYFTSLRITA